jgi:anaerobic dimethyl sulfoxide reductase subunit B (iron-sulfur subunit)
MQYAFYYDQTRCIGCGACTVACKDWNGIEPGPARWREVTTTFVGEFPHVSVINLSMSCNHCATPACVAACPADAIYKREEDGIVMIDRSRCIGCRACIAACPFGAPTYADDAQEPVKDPSWKVKHPTQKCVFCWDRWAVGKKPACVMACPNRALDAGPMNEITAKYPDAVKVVRGFPDPSRAPNGNMLESGYTGPNIYFKAKPAGVPVVVEDPVTA